MICGPSFIVILSCGFQWMGFLCMLFAGVINLYIDDAFLIATSPKKLQKIQGLEESENLSLMLNNNKKSNGSIKDRISPKYKSMLLILELVSSEQRAADQVASPGIHRISILRWIFKHKIIIDK